MRKFGWAAFVSFVALGWSLGWVGAVPATPILVFSNNFTTAVGPEWSSTCPGTCGPDISPRISTTPSGRNFLGAHRTFGFDNHAVDFALSGLPDHTAVNLTFDLFIIKSWEGNLSLFDGPDRWILTFNPGGGLPVVDLLTTTFSNHPSDSQAYPGMFPGANNPPRTGAIESNTLGYQLFDFGDTVYRLDFTFDHSDETLLLQFRGSGLQPFGSQASSVQEGWGLDNVRVEVAPTPVPEPSTLLLLGSGFAGLFAWRLRKVHPS